MPQNTMEQMLQHGKTPQMQERTIQYLAEQFGTFLKKRERVLICFPSHEEGSLSWMMEQAVSRCEAIPVIWGPDHRWKTLLQQAFYSHAGTIVGPPLIVLGLAKLKRQNAIPLYIRRVVTAGYPCLDWMIDGIIKEMDCKTWGAFGIGTTGVVAGFSCGVSRGIHLWDEVYGIEIVDDRGNPVPDGQLGEMVLYPKAQPSLRYPLGEVGRLEKAPCPCGCKRTRLVDMHPGKTEPEDILELAQYLQSWTSVLDCRIQRGEYGLELDLVVFPGEKLPKLPSAAKQIVRPWDPKHDEPFIYAPEWKNPAISEKNH